MLVKRINLSEFVGDEITALTGTENGGCLLQDMELSLCRVLEDLEQEYGIIRFIMPSQLVTINYSYFIGFLGKRVERLGKKAFLKKYSFITSGFIYVKLLGHIDKLLFGDPSGVGIPPLKKFWCKGCSHLQMQDCKFTCDLECVMRVRSTRNCDIKLAPNKPKTCLKKRMEIYVK